MVRFLSGSTSWGPERDSCLFRLRWAPSLHIPSAVDATAVRDVVHQHVIARRELGEAAVDEEVIRRGGREGVQSALSAAQLRNSLQLNATPLTKPVAKDLVSDAVARPEPLTTEQQDTLRLRRGAEESAMPNP